MKRQRMISCILVVISLITIFLPAGGAEAFRGSLDRGGILVNPPSGVGTTPAQPAPTQPAPVPAPTQPADSNNGGSSRFSPSNRGYTPAPLPSGGGTPSVPEPPSPPQPPQQTPDIPAAPSWLNANEAKGFTLLNETRVKNNLKPVMISHQLTEVARMKAKDMIENNYFSHTSPTYGSLGTMLRNAGVSYKIAAENLSKAGNITQCHLQLEYSTTGHRQIMLNPKYNNVGIAVLPLKNTPGILMVQIYTD